LRYVLLEITLNAGSVVLEGAAATGRRRTARRRTARRTWPGYTTRVGPFYGASVNSCSL